jgi:hypothetical protein
MIIIKRRKAINMKVSIIYFLVLGICTLSLAQEAKKSPASKENQKQPVVKDLGQVQGKSDKEINSTTPDTSENQAAPNVIDFKKAPQKVEPKKVTNTLTGEDKVRQAMGPADTTAPKQQLEKKQEQTTVKKSELLKKLKDPKPIKPKEKE